jgi:hypothetical protein
MSGEDYVMTTGQLVFAPNTWTQVFTVATVEDDQNERTEMLKIMMQDPVSATLGIDMATLSIMDDDELTQLDVVLIDDFEDGQLLGGVWRWCYGWFCDMARW